MRFTVPKRSSRRKPSRGGFHRSGKAVRACLYEHDCVEAQQAEIGEVVSRQALAPEMGVDEAQAAEAAGAGAVTTEVRDEELVGVADDHVGDTAATIDHHADLAVELA